MFGFRRKSPVMTPALALDLSANAIYRDYETHVRAGSDRQTLTEILTALGGCHLALSWAVLPTSETSSLDIRAAGLLTLEIANVGEVPAWRPVGDDYGPDGSCTPQADFAYALDAVRAAYAYWDTCLVEERAEANSYPRAFIAERIKSLWEPTVAILGYAVAWNALIPILRAHGSDFVPTRTVNVR